MDQIPLIAFEHILSFLNSLDRYNAIIAFQYDSTVLARRLTNKISLAFEYRFRCHMFSKLIGIRKQFIKEVDLTGIYWIRRHVIFTACSRLPNLENLYLLGTSVQVPSNELFKTFKSYLKIKSVAVTVIKDLNNKKTAYCLLQRKATSQLDAIEFDVILLLRTNMVRPIFSNDWLTLVKAGVSGEEIHRHIKMSSTEVTYMDFFADEQNIKQFFHELRDVKTLLVKSSKLPVGCKTVDIEPIKCLVNLTFLHVDVEYSLGQMFLKPILQSCSNLKTLRIRCYAEAFSLAHFKYASEKLEDLSVNMVNGMFFNMNKFLFDITANPSIQLRRIYLHYGGLSADMKYAMGNLANFMQSNPQLIFFYICSKDVRKHIYNIKDVFKRFKKEPHQFFSCQHTIYDVKPSEISSQFNGIPIPCSDIPLQHVDMFDI